MYKVEIKFVTDGDFGWKFLPVDFDVYCEGEEYCFYGTFESYNSLLTWANKNLPFLIEHVVGDYKTEDVKKSLTKLHNNIKENKLPTYESWDGNYDGTLIMCRKELPSIQIAEKNFLLFKSMLLLPMNFTNVSMPVIISQLAILEQP